jgi:hypothetical protein
MVGNLESTIEWDESVGSVVERVEAAVVSEMRVRG